MPGEPRSRSETLTSEASKGRHLRQVAAEIILSAPDLTDTLTDDEARPLIRWGVMQAEAAADDLAEASQATGGNPSGSNPGDILTDRLDPVRRVMKCINRLVGNRRGPPPEEVLEELERLFALAEGLPRPPQSEIAAVSVAELGARGTELDKGAIVQAIVGLLEGSTWGSAQEGSQQLDR